MNEFLNLSEKKKLQVARTHYNLHRKRENRYQILYPTIKT